MSATEPTATAAAATRGGPRLGLALLGSELAVLFTRTRTIAMLAALAAVPVLVAVAIRLSGSSGRGPSFVAQIAGNGLFVGIAALLLCVPLFLPLTVGVVAGDAIAGEAASGTLRYLLVAPAGRARLLAVKAAAVAVFCFVAPLVVVAAGTIAGAILFPVGPIPLLSGDQVPVADGIARLLLAATQTGVAMLGLAAVGLLFSTLTDVPVGAMAATVVLAVASQVLGQLPQLDALHPFLLSDSWLGFVGALRNPVDGDAFRTNALLQLGWVVVAGALAFGRFTTKDVLS